VSASPVAERPRELRASAPVPKVVHHRGTLSRELRKQRGASNHMVLVPHFDLTFLSERAVMVLGTSNRRHSPFAGSVPSPEAQEKCRTFRLFTPRAAAAAMIAPRA
jgi:hypothetical protein